MHLSDLAVTGRAFDAGLQVRLVSEEHIGLFLNPEYAPPDWLLAALEQGCQLLNFGALGLDCGMAAHARGCIGYGSVARLVCVFVAEVTFELWAFVLGEMLPMIEFNGLGGGFCSRAHPQQQQSDCEDNNPKD